MRAAIFDMDGTLLDSMGVWRGLLPRFLTERGIRPDSRALLESSALTLPNLVRLLAEDYGIATSAGEIRALWQGWLEEAYATTIALKPFAREYLLLLRGRGVKLALATMTGHVLVDPALRRFELDGLFDAVLTIEDVGDARKDRPDIFLRAAGLMGVSPSDCAVFEDSLYAAKTALKAGFAVCGVEDPHTGDGPALRAVCTRTVSGWRELVDEIKPSPGSET